MRNLSSGIIVLQKYVYVKNLDLKFIIKDRTQ